MDELKILVYSDSKYEYQVDALIESLHLNGQSRLKVIYYTIGFESSLVYPGLEKKFWKINSKFERFPFYKPEICLDALESFGGNILFLDSDIIIGKRFKPEFFIHKLDFPLLSVGNWEFPFFFYTVPSDIPFPKFGLDERIVLNDAPKFGNIVGINDDQSYMISLDAEKEALKICEDQIRNLRIKDHSKLMRYYGVGSPTMDYVYSCCLSFNQSCKRFIKEWKSITENEYLNSFGREYYPIAEETAINVTLWKNKVNINFGKIFVNTLYAKAVEFVECNDDIKNQNVFNNELQKCEDSSKILFYHGMIEKSEIDRVLSFMRLRNL